MVADKKIFSLTYSFILFTSFLAIFIGEGTHMIYMDAKNDILISSIIGFILSFIFLYVVIAIMNKNEKEDVFELNKDIFKSGFGKILNLMLTIGFFIVSFLVLYSMADFLNTEYLHETSIDYLKILVLIPVVYITSKKFNVIAKSNQILSFISLGIIIFCFIGIFEAFEFKNFEPLFATSKTTILKNSIKYMIMSTVPLSLLLLTSKNNIVDQSNLNSNILKMFILSNIVIIAIICGTILSLGMEYIQIFRFPEYVALKQFSLFGILERVENILAIQYFFNNIGIISLLYYAICKRLPETSMKKYYSIIIGAIQIILTHFIFSNTNNFLEMIQKYMTYIIFIFITLPILIIFFKLTKKSK